MSGIVLDLKEGVASLCFSSAKANSLDSNLLRQFIKEVDRLSADPSCKVIVLKSEGPTFCAGASFDEMKSLTTLESATDFFSLFGELTLALRMASQPVIAQVQGKAVGGGVGLVAASDVSVALDSAAFKLSEFSVGIGPFAISPVLEWKIGLARLSELALIGDWISAEQALRIGLLSEVCQSDLVSRVDELARKISGYSISPLQKFKKIVSGTVDIQRKSIRARAAETAQALLSNLPKSL